MAHKQSATPAPSGGRPHRRPGTRPSGRAAPGTGQEGPAPAPAPDALPLGAAATRDRLALPIIEEAKVHHEAQHLAAKERDLEAILKEEVAHAARLTHAMEAIVEYEAIRDAAISNVPVDERLDALLESICLMLGSQAAAVLLMDDEGEELWPRTSLGFETTLAVRPTPVTGIIREVIGTGRPIIITDLQPSQEFRPGLLEEGIRALVAVPMRMNGGIGGVIVCAHREPNWFKPADADLLQSIADLIAAGLHRARTLEAQTRRRRRSEHASRFKSELLDMATHDIKTPLTTLGLHLEIIGDAKLPEDQRQRSVATMRRSVARLTAMLDDFLDLARAQGNRLTVHPARLRVADLFREALESFEPLVAKNGMAIEADAAGGLEVVGDERRIMQVLTNLVSNAIRFSPPGGAIRLTARDAPDHVELHVIDQGRGMNPQQLSRLFQPFVQVHDTAGNSQGSGLGLYLSKAIVGAHGGRLWLTSAGPGLGTDAAFTLPKEHAGLPEGALRA
jgi:signal transduction histidine kinase